MNYEELLDKIDEDSDFKLIWGIRDCGLLANSLYDMTDIDIIQNKETKEYFLEFEEIYAFNTDSDRIKYYKELVDKFKEWLIENNYEVDEDNIYTKSNCFEYYYPTGVLEKIMPLKDMNLVQLYYKAKLFIICLEAIYSTINTGLEK